MKSITKIFLPLAALAVAATTGSTCAATVAYVGGQSNMELFTNDATDGWRNATTAKPLDIDGDNIIGTDGYDFAGGSTVVALPSYVASSTASGGHSDNNRGLVDNPLDASGADIGIGWQGNMGSWTFVFQGSALETETLRLGVLYDGTWSLAWGTQTYTLTQTVGGSDSDTSPTLTTAGDGLDVAYFDLTGVQDGDTFQLTVADVSIGWNHVAGVTFDTAPVPEPSTTALLGLGGLALILRRRK
ncbi:MAG: PEP-CTERM sorting domain-containing protein [Akkermansiaceae bacterium]|tara:strand:+ start:481 stop:1212 length:732 start_codon:yes stop_codon:yes gene_type:complete